MREMGKILIADDDPAMRDFLAASLTTEGFQVVMARDGEEVLDVAIEQNPELILMEVEMDKLDGVEVCRRLRQDSRTSAVCIIMVTGKTIAAVEGLSAGADDYVIKPFNPIELIARIGGTLLRTRSMRDRNPLSGMPGNGAILADVTRRIDSDEAFGLLHIDLDNFKAFNDRYGFGRGDQAINLMATILKGLLRDSSGEAFAGHIGGDDFAVVCPPESVEILAALIMNSFDTQIGSLYDPGDIERGYITIQDRRGTLQRYPIMTVSIGIATNYERRFESAAQVSEIAGEMKSLSKREPVSFYSIDRRYQ